MTTTQPTELPIACPICGQVTRHHCPYALAPLSRWACEHASNHQFVLAAPAPRSNVYALRVRQANKAD